MLCEGVPSLARKVAIPAIIISIVILAAALRIWGSAWGLPTAQHYFSYHPDETVVLSAAMRINFFTGQIDPGFYNYGSLYIYLVAFSILFGSGWGLINLPASNLLSAAHIGEFSNLYMAGRIVSLLMGIATVYLVYALGKRAYGRKVGILAASFMAVMPIHVMHSKFLAVDVPATFFVTLALIFAFRIVDGRRWKDYLLAGVFVGLAAATKYNAGLVILSPIVAHFVSDTRKPSRRLLSLKLLSIILATAVAFFAGTPGALMNSGKFASDFAYEVLHVRTGHGLVFTDTGNGYIYHIAHSLYYGMGLPLLILAVAGLIYALARRSRSDLILLTFALVYYAVIGAAQVRFARYTIPMLPVLALLAARVTIDVCKRTSERKVMAIGCAAALALVMAYTLAYSLSIDRVYAATDTRDAAAAWISANVPANSSIAFPTIPWFYTPPVRPNFGAMMVSQRLQGASQMPPYRLIVGDVEWDANLLKQQSPAYIVLSSFEYEDRVRLHDSSVKSYFDMLNANYRLQHRFDERLSLGGWQIPLIGKLPHDMSYASPDILIYSRK